MGDTRLLRDALGWGVGLWFFGYVLGVVLFFALPVSLIGWAITPVAIAVTLWVLTQQVKRGPLQRYVVIGVIWSGLAIALDYLFIVKLLNPEDGYYKLDVYLYYALTFLLPILAGRRVTVS